MKQDYPTTLKRAKEIAKIRLGRLPRPGHSIVVGGIFTGNPPVRRWKYQLELINHSGKFYLSSWTMPFSNPDMSQFKTIEHEKDYRYE
jgi:hypothetical protein